MNVYVLIVLALFRGVLGNSCFDGLSETCPTVRGNPFTFPETAKDIAAVCPKILSHIECIEKYVAECGGEVVHNLESLPKLKRYITDVCDEDSTVRDDIVEELPCLKNAFDELNDNCLELSRDAMEKHANENDLDYDSPDYQKFHQRYSCFYLTSRLACIADQVYRKCGKRASDIVLDAHFRTGYLDLDCKKDDHDEFLDLVAALEIDSAQKAQIRSIQRHVMKRNGRRHCDLQCLLRLREPRDPL